MVNKPQSREERYLSALNFIYDMALELADDREPVVQPRIINAPMRAAERYLYNFNLPFEKYFERCGGLFAPIASSNNSRARKMGKHGELTARQVAALWYAQRGISPLSGEQIAFKDRALDHIHTLSLGGQNVISNAMFITKPENSSKHAARLEDYCYKKGLNIDQIQFNIDQIHRELRRIA